MGFIERALGCSECGVALGIPRSRFRRGDQLRLLGNAQVQIGAFRCERIEQRAGIGEHLAVLP
jgi:hypothetical protein